MANPTGILAVTVNGREYKLHLGWSVLAELQEKHGQDFIQKLEPPEGASKEWLPPFSVIVDVLLAALQRHHADEADRWLVDDMIVQCPDVFYALMRGSFPDAPKGQKSGNGKRPKAAA